VDRATRQRKRRVRVAEHPGAPGTYRSCTDSRVVAVDVCVRSVLFEVIKGSALLAMLLRRSELAAEEMCRPTRMMSFEPKANIIILFDQAQEPI
jgi:hypothetical protein